MQEEEDDLGEEEASTSHSIDKEAQLRASSEPQEKLRKEDAQISSKRENGKKSQGTRSKARRKSKSGGREKSAQGEEEEDLDEILKSLDIKIVSRLGAMHGV